MKLLTDLTAVTVCAAIVLYIGINIGIDLEQSKPKLATITIVESKPVKFNVSLVDACDDDEIKGWCTSTTPPMTREQYEMELGQ